MTEKMKALDPAVGLFSRIYDALSLLLHPCQIRLEYFQEGGLLGMRFFEITLDSWGIHWIIRGEKDWQDYRLAHGLLEADEYAGQSEERWGS